MLNMEYKNEYELVERELWLYNKGRWKSFYFLRHILCFLRQHPELCKQSSYKELYDETIVLLILEAHAMNYWTNNSPSDQQGWIELFADLENQNADGNFEFFTIEIINDYLVYRKKRWASGRKYTKECCGFIS